MGGRSEGRRTSEGMLVLKTRIPHIQAPVADIATLYPPPHWRRL